ncbi:uncharacterized protein LOC120694507 [Panicum virgatum]|uniref:Uncharacterized protein n=1 Tax=Panicum virgatum TaxID=38727 RepID=A0A8T0WBG3_PANVG|nr:uncharacterized protein LOC120694507 [Panicum virgatum]KAG2646861.1 hypothetical protein PVAP13_2KG550900 [Panicum virgatum]
MEVVVPVMAPSAPCSPRTAAIAGGDHLPGYCYFFSSAPTSPSRASYPGDASPGAGGDEATFDFTLGFSGQLQEATPILADADELFEGGRIRPLNTPHPSILMFDDTSSTGPRSPRRAGDQAEALERGRSGRPAAAPASAASSRSRRATRSLSPFRGGGGGGGIEDDEDPSSPPSPRTSMTRGCGSGSKKWRLKDLFLFRSASEGRATGGGSKDPLFKYTMLSPSTSFSHPQKLKSGDGSASMRKGRGSTASASDMPYATNRAAAEDMRRRTTTPLPFHRNSLFGYLRSNPAIHSISRKLGNNSSNRGRPT